MMSPALISPPRRRGFTAVELIVAMAISLFLMLGINAVFHMTAETVGTGVALTQMTQTSRAVQTALADDFRHAHATPPVFCLACYALPGSYLNTADQNAYPSFTQPGAGVWDPVWYGHDNRCDKMSFFVTGENYQRQTGDWPSFVSSTTSPEAYVSYGLLRQYNNGPVFGTFYPGSSNATSNPNNFYSVNWVLGRNAVVLVDYSQTLQNLDGSLGTIPNGNGEGAVTDNNFFARATQYNLQSEPGSPNNNPPNPLTTSVADSLYVLGYLDGGQTNAGGLPYGVGMAVGPTNYSVNDPNTQFQADPWATRDPTTAFPNNPTQGLFWSIDRSRYDLAAVTADEFRTDIYQVSMYLPNLPGYNSSQASTFYANPTMQVPNWWNPLVLDGLGEPFLFECKLAKPAWTTTVNTTQVSVLGYTPTQSQNVALQAPVLAAHVSNFIVEYAGDYLTQTNAPGPTYGTITGAGADGTVDYTVDGNGSRQIRWYGLTRSSRSDGNFDVQPLRTVLASVGAQPAAFEVDNQSNPNLYVCVWRGTMPAMVRVTIKVEDSTNHLQNGRWYEFILNRPGGVIN